MSAIISLSSKEDGGERGVHRSRRDACDADLFIFFFFLSLAKAAKSFDFAAFVVFSHSCPHFVPFGGICVQLCG